MKSSAEKAQLEGQLGLGDESDGEAVNASMHPPPPPPTPSSSLVKDGQGDGKTVGVTFIMTT